MSDFAQQKYCYKKRWAFNFIKIGHYASAVSKQQEETINRV